VSDVAFWIIAGGAVLIGAAVQSSVGMGLGLVAAPVVTLLEPSLMPGTVLITTAILPVMTLASEYRHVDLRGIGWALAGRIVGVAGGVWVVTVLSARTLGIAVGAMVLVAIAVTLSKVHVRATRATLGAAGVISGVSGTATSIGGPPMAIVYQNEPGPRVRSSLSLYFIVGVTVSLIALRSSGHLGRDVILTGLGLVPFILIGFLLARPLRQHVDGRILRYGLLTVAGAGAVALITQAVI
jgi:uncharacterized membrane protein YfcA